MGGGRLPDFVGVGVPRAGTTWLFRCLSDHPDVFIPPMKELNFFDHGTIRGRLDDYRAHFAEAGAATAVGEISTRYFSSTVAPERMATILPEARLFVVFRNPVDQVYSHYWHLARQNFHQWDLSRVPDSFEEALRDFDDKLVEPALYATHLRRWRRWFPDNRIEVILFHDIVERPRDVLAGLYAHLGVRDDHVPDALDRRGTQTRAGVSPRNHVLGTLHRLLHNKLSVGVYYRLKEWLGVRRASRIKRALPVRKVLELLFMRRGYPEMDAAVRDELVERFRPEVERLSDMIDRDLSRLWAP